MTTDLARAKAVVLAHHAALARAEPACCATTLSQHYLPDTLWRGMHPFHEQRGPQAVADAFWSPFLSAMSRVQRRQDIFFAGHNHLDEGGGTWVASMGHLMGLFDAPFLGIRPTRKITMVRYAEFSKVEGDRIVEQALFVDLLHLMAQAGQYPLPGMTGAQLVQPGPLTHDGLLFDDQDKDVGQATLDRIHAMMEAITQANASDTPLPPEQELARDWHDDMIWWGPTGIGATYTIDRYIEQHQRPFRTQLGDRTFNGHICRMAEGNYGGFFGWPNLTMECTGPYMGLPPSGRKADMRVVDIYRRDGDKLAENWVFIDILHFLNMQGLDVLAQLDVRKG
ncbi:ester cyclase [uncultured Tateyamaria sp.]|uniref:ester cyclase n=1 Tax=uncultured Tateyamaria sp. TaxID=455651 RepID=UPI0026130F31|nr:ester cyclase [uncultured Tateyamaria sp.]